MTRQKPGAVAFIVAGVIVAVASATALVFAVSSSNADMPTAASAPAGSISPDPVASSPATPSPTNAPPGPPSPAAAPTAPAPILDPSSVAGAYERAGHWWVSCGSPHAVLPQDFEYGCAITGHEPDAVTLLTDEAPAATASPADAALGAQLLEQWIPYDSSAAADGQARAAEIAPRAELPPQPVLAWSTKAAELDDAGFRADVGLSGEPQLMTTTAAADGQHLTYSVPIAAIYSIDRSCLPEDVASSANCVLVTLDQPLLWTVVITDGHVTGLIEPSPFASR